ncbi:hypothetical protein [Lysinibacillus xylanilyticus]|uniref:Uncharacterized protein n=1 Tax=Lysinibacillus xylanilyticus TaxID=582475 RepID=A0A2M9PXK4_9BACI|nr:hypothetical protein [Lysinibacillus xylanilyticus]PJO40546.1 hypothetical protein CWD94_27565 [Lysinibacillus xylanilyticus]
MQLKFLSENFGIGKTSNKPYHMIKLADPNTFENHTISVDPAYIQPPLNFATGQLLEIEGRLATPFNNTQFIATVIKQVKEA